MKLILTISLGVAVSFAGYAQNKITIPHTVEIGGEPPIWVSSSGISGEALQVLQFDLNVQGFAFTNVDNAQYQISGSANGNLQGRITDRISKANVLSKSYSGASLRRQVHAFVDDFMTQLQRKPICQTRVAFKGITGQNSEIFVSDFDGANAQSITHDNTIAAAPCWAGHNEMFYVSYKLNHADIFSQDLGNGSRKAFARYGGSNMSPAVSPDRSKVAMILSKDGWTDLYVCNIDGTGLTRLTKSPQDESSPCWSPDSKYICFASKENERRALRKISASGGTAKGIGTTGGINPTEPDWSPDGKYIAFTSQTGSFQICVVPAEGGEAIVLVEGEDPSWSPNSRTLCCSRRTGDGYVLSLLDVPTKLHRDISHITGSRSQSQPSWAR